MGIIVAQGMGIHRQLPMAIHRLHMVTQLRPTATPLRLMGIPITDRGTIPATGTVLIMAEGAMLTVVMGIGGNQETGRTGPCPCAREVTEPQRTNQSRGEHISPVFFISALSGCPNTQKPWVSLLCNGPREPEVRGSGVSIRQLRGIEQ